jgi:RNA polymerase sigma-70 factor (ECF subfamily)
MGSETHELILRAHAGDEGAYEALFTRHAARLQLYVRLRLGVSLAARLDPWDVVQETYLAAHRGFAEFEARGPGAFSHWLNRIAANRIRDLSDHFGSQKRRLPAPRAEDSAALGRIRASVTGPATASERQERHLRVHAALAALDPGPREAVFLRFFEGYTYQELGQALGCSRETARQQIALAVGVLGGSLADLA